MTRATRTRKAAAHRFAICVDNSEYRASLELHKIYRVLPNEGPAQASDLRVIDESGEDYLYPAECFVLVDLPRQTVRAINKAYARGWKR